MLIPNPSIFEIFNDLMRSDDSDIFQSSLKNQELVMGSCEYGSKLKKRLQATLQINE